MDIDEHQSDHHHHTARVKIDGEEFRVPQQRASVAELLELVGKDESGWRLEAELHGGDRVVLSGEDEVDLREGHIAEFRTVRHEGHHHHHHHEFEITVVVNSAPLPIEVKPDERLSAIVAQVLKKANATGRPEDQWELRTEAGVILDLSLTVAEAHIECGTTLFLSLKAGAAGEASGELLVDPAVSMAKFDEQVAKYREIESQMHRRGIWLVKAEYPKVHLLFGTPNNPGAVSMLAFGAVLDFSNYDLWAPSVRLVNPYTWVPYKKSELPMVANLLRQQPGAPTPVAGLPVQAVALMQAHSDTEIPFLCMPGVREYHEHPAHTGDSWMRHRETEEGTLHHLTDILFHYGSSRAGLIIQQIAVPAP